ncbi:MAG: ABC transporter substrate binding protein [Desulfomicrobium sp.]|nr:ABC transporter substrate binding protein [Desulfomicrobium sp.]
MMKDVLFVAVALTWLLAVPLEAADSVVGKKVLFVSSYHDGLAGADDVVAGVKEGFQGSGVNMTFTYMDTKRNPSESFAKETALRIKAEIERLRPDIVIASDDAAAKYLIQPYYRDVDLPIVFCGVNWDASVYGFPSRNVTGVNEVELVPQMLRMLKVYARGDRMGYLAADTLPERKNIEFHQKLFGLTYSTGHFVKTFDEYKAAYLQLQKDADLIVMLSPSGITGWDDAEAKDFVLKNATIPSGAMVPWAAPYSLLTFSQILKEQGTLASGIALRILRGERPMDIPITENTGGTLFINMPIAMHLGITFDTKLLRLAEIIR